MKHKFALTILIFFSSLVYGQDQDKMYYNSEGKGLADASGASYYRTVFFDTLRNMVDSVRDYYMGGGIRLKGVALKIDKDDDKETIWVGRKLMYYKSGKLMADDFFNKLGKMDSVSTRYFESGKVRQLLVCKNGAVVDKFYKEWDEMDHCEKVFSDQFRYNNNKNGWPLNTNDKHDCKIIQNEGLEINTFGDNGAFQTLELPLEPNKNYSIETVVNYESGDFYLLHGLIWGFKDLDNYFFYYISADGHYQIGYFTQGIINYYVRNGQSQDIRYGKGVDNKLKILTSKGKMFYSVNGIVLYQAKAYDCAGNRIGFMNLQGKQQVLFRNIMVRQNTEDNSSAETPGSSAGSANSEFKGWKEFGTGFFIDSRGYIATAYHVIDNAGEIEVDVTKDGEKIPYKAVLVSGDKQNDLALLKITDDKFAPFASLPYNFKTGVLDVASDVYTLGFPIASLMGTEVKFTDGKISSKTGANGSPESYQISVPIQPGNSGGPLFDDNGNIVGIVDAKMIGIAMSNVAYAIKSSYLKSFLDALSEKLTLPHDPSLGNKPLTEKIKVLTDYVVWIKVK